MQSTVIVFSSVGIDYKSAPARSKVIIEIKAVEELNPVHFAQLMTYLKLSKCRMGFLINFNVPSLKDGIKRVIL